MIDSYLRDPYQKTFVTPVIRRLTQWKTSPLFITFLGLLTGIAVIPFLYFGQSGSALFLLLLSGYFDTLDGSLARERHATSDRGAVLDIVADRIVEFSVVYGLYLVDPVGRGALCLLILGSILICVTSFLVVGIFSQNEGYKSFHYSPGLMERSEAFFFFALLILFPQLFFSLGTLLAGLITLTAVIRVWQFSSIAPCCDTPHPHHPTPLSIRSERD